MSAPAAPLEAHDPDRARALKAKIRDRVTDVRRHLIALRTAMAEFGDDFDLDEFKQAHDGDDPAALNRVNAVERGVDKLYGVTSQLAPTSEATNGSHKWQVRRVGAARYLRWQPRRGCGLPQRRLGGGLTRMIVGLIVMMT